MTKFTQQHTPVLDNFTLSIHQILIRVHLILRLKHTMAYSFNKVVLLAMRLRSMTWWAPDLWSGAFQWLVGWLRKHPSFIGQFKNTCIVFVNKTIYGPAVYGPAVYVAVCSSMHYGLLLDSGIITGYGLRYVILCLSPNCRQNALLRDHFTALQHADSFNR